MSDARVKDELHTPGTMRFYRPEGTQESNADFWCFDTGKGFIENGVGFSVSGLITAGDARRLAACWDRMQLLTTPGIERHTPAQIERALLNADGERLRIGELERTLSLWQQFAGYCRSCAICGERDPSEFEAFKARAALAVPAAKLEGVDNGNE